jgi:hypothetical protein
MRLIVVASFVVATTTVSAHHSFAMFDQAKTVTLSGTVKDFQFNSPHVWIQLLVPTDKGEPVEWGIEMSSPGSLLRRGWSKSSLKPGDKVFVDISPLRDGSPGGQFKSATRADGTPVTRAVRRVE